MPSAPAKTRRRWFQFNTWTVLLTVTAIGLWLGWWTSSAKRQRAAVRTLTAQGVAIGYDVEYGWASHGPAPRLTEPNWIEQKLGTDYAHNVTFVASYWTGSTATKEQVLDACGSFPRLTSLFLGFELDDDDMRVVGGFSGLEFLDFAGPKLTDAGWQCLGRLRRLNALEIHRATLTASSVREIGRLRSLTSVSLCACQIDAAALRELGSLTQLTNFGVVSGEIVDEQLRVVARLKQVQDLFLESCSGVTDEGFKSLGELTELRELYLSDLRPSEAKIDVLIRLKKLVRIQLYGRGLDESPTDLARLQLALPNCDVTSDWSD